jgi:hypothetical protein
MRGARGQAVVETALTMPLSVFLILGILQIGLMQQAHLLTEYAAFQAARAGVVHHGDVNQMKDAAFLSLMPTFTLVYTDNTLANVIAQLTSYERLGMQAYLTAEAAKWEDFAQVDKTPGAALAILQANHFDFIQIQIVLPSGSARYDTFGADVDPPNPGPEIDFDDVSSAGAIDSNLLSIRLTYYYVMRVPLANWVIHNAFVAQQAGVALTRGELLDQRSADDLVEQLSTGAGGAALTAAAANVSEELQTLRLLSVAGLYVVPLRANYTIRMQSNQFQKFMP